MKILYIILTSPKTSDKRKAQEETWLKYIGEKDEYVYLDSIMNVADTYESVPYKYSYFIKTYKRFTDFDWVFFCDDDTFLFPKKLGHLLHYFDKEKPIMIGRTGVYEGWTVCSGGAGFAVSKKLITTVQEHFKKTSFIHLPNSDTSFGMWARLAEPKLEIIDRTDQFQSQHFSHEDNGAIDVDCCLTFHYCSLLDYKTLSKYLKYATH